MNLEELLEAIAREKRIRGEVPVMPHAKLVKDWWPKPKIRPLPKPLWGNRWQNTNSAYLHKYECWSFSEIGFNPRDPVIDGIPQAECVAYGETPNQAYDTWCQVFNSWNKKEDWIK